MSRAIEGNPQINVVRTRAQGIHGRAQTASGRFDTHITAGIAGTRQAVHAAATDAPSTGGQRATGYSIEAVRQLRSGIVLNPAITLSRTDHEGLAHSEAAANLTMGMAVPLLRDRFGRASAAPERALRLRADATDDDVRHVVAYGAAQAAEAYWEYAAAFERRGVLTQAEERARRRLEETRTLVRGDERPAAELTPLEASHARARAQRVLAEQEIEEARARLGNAMGLDLAATAAIPAPGTAFPRADPAALRAMDEERLVRVALVQRGDLAAIRMELQSDDVLLGAAREEMKPQFDLQLSVGYAGRHSGGGRGAYLEPLYRDVPGMNATVRLEFQIPPAQSAAQGALAQARAAQHEKALYVDDLVRGISANVSLAVRALQSGAEAVRDAERAVELYALAVQNEQQKHRLGAATLFDVTYVEDNLTNAQLAAVSARLAYTRRLVQLRMETGSLSEDSPDGPTVNPSRLLQLP